jgi:hypothetical protein
VREQSVMYTWPSDNIGVAIDRTAAFAHAFA